MSLYLLKNNSNNNKLGIAVSKKFSKSSVRRNRVKRLLKEVYRVNEEKIVIGNSIVILWKNNVKYDKVNFENIANDFLKCIKKANIFVNES